MSLAIETARRETTGWKVYVLAAYYWIASNLALSAVGAGIVQVAIAFGIDAVYGPDQGNISVLAGYLGIWGVSMIIIGLVVYAAFWLNRFYGQRVLNKQDA